jgi:hypothetical protein
MNSSQEIACELVVSGGDAAEVPEPAEAALDYISASVSTLVEAMDSRSRPWTFFTDDSFTY